MSHNGSGFGRPNSFGSPTPKPVKRSSPFQVLVAFGALAIVTGVALLGLGVAIGLVIEAAGWVAS